METESSGGSIDYRTDDRCTVEEVEELFRQSGIRRPVGDRERIQRMIDHADEILTARQGARLVGLLRAITDYAYCCYISDVAVDRDYQGRGIGARLVGLLRDKLGEDEIQYVLTSAPKATGFYDKIGFEQAHNAYVIKRRIN